MPDILTPRGAYLTEYDLFGIRTTSIGGFVPSTGNNAGMKDVVGGSSDQTTQRPISPTGDIRSSDSVGYNVGTGWWMGFDTDGTPKMFIGKSTGNSMTWNGSALSITGTIVGSLIETAVSPNQRLVLDASDNSFRAYDASNNNTFTINASNARFISETLSATNTTGIFISSAIDNTIGLDIQSSTNIKLTPINIQMSSATSGNNGVAINIVHNGTSATSRGLNITKTGSGEAINITNSGATTTVSIVVSKNTTHGLFLANTDVGGSGYLAHFETTTNGSTLELVGGTPTGNAGVLNIAATNTGDCISLVQNGDATSLPVIGLHLNVTSSVAAPNNVKVYAMRFDGDAVVNASVGPTQDQKIRVLVGAATYYIPCYTT